MVGGTDDTRRAVACVLREAELRRALSEGAAFVVIQERSIIWASPSAGEALGEAVVRPGPVEAGSLLEPFIPLATSLVPGAAPRLERLRGSRLAARTLACRVLLLEDGRPILILIVMGVRGGAVDPATLLAEPDMVEPPAPLPASLDDLRARAGGRNVLRFVWHSDARSVFVAASPELRDCLGGDLPAITGQSWAQLLQAGIQDVQGVALALTRPETFHALLTRWPVEAGKTALQVHLSGVPALDRDRQLVGFRGFGLCRLDALELLASPVREPVSDMNASPMPDIGWPSPPASGIEADGFPPAGDHANQNEPIQHPDDDERADAKPVDRPKAEVRPSALDKGLQEVPARSASPPRIMAQRPVTVAPASTPSALSPSERLAFREIARALGARFADEEPQSPRLSPARPAREVVNMPAPPAPTVSPVQTRTDVPDRRANEAGDTSLQPQTSPIQPETGILERLPVGLLVCRGESVLWANRHCLELLGYADLSSLEDRGGMQELFRGRSSFGEQQGDAATELLTSTGETVTAEVRVQMVPWGDHPATLFTIRRAPEIEALPRLKAAELDARRREAELRELRAILDTATDGVIVVDGSGHILALNRSGEALFGYDRDEVMGETFIALFAPESHSLALDYLEGLRSSGVASLLNDGREVIGRVRQGGRIPLFMTLGRISDSPDEKFCAVLRDITPWKRAEGDLLDAKRAAETASAQKSDFLARISHEIRTPLSAIIGFAEVMMEERFGAIANERYKEYLKDIYTSGGHVISLVNDLLDLSKIEAGRFELSFESVELNELVSSSVSLMQAQALEARVVLRSSLPGALPRIVADQRSLRQIILNVLSNAVKFTDPGGQVIVSTALTDTGEVVMRVRDTGIGMSESEIETALEPFRQITTPGRVGHGTGLGLPLTKALVEANRAVLIIRSAKQAGTLVEIVFPKARVLAE